jgi:hypothetical protein
VDPGRHLELAEALGKSVEDPSYGIPNLAGVGRKRLQDPEDIEEEGLVRDPFHAGQTLRGPDEEEDRLEWTDVEGDPSDELAPRTFQGVGQRGKATRDLPFDALVLDHVVEPEEKTRGAFSRTDPSRLTSISRKSV